MKRKYRMFLIVGMIAAVAFCTISVSAFEISEVPSDVYGYLERDEIFTDVLRQLGSWLYWLLGGLLDFAQEGFTSLATFDILGDSTLATELKPITENVKTVLIPLMGGAFGIIVIFKLFRMENAFKTLYNSVLAVFAISLFFNLFSLIDDMKNDLIDISSDVFASAENTTMSEKLYLENTVDLVESIQQQKPVSLADMGMSGDDLEYLNYNIRMAKDGDEGLDEYYEFDVQNGEKVKLTKELTDGIFGIGSVSYYRYKADWMNINITTIASIIIYALAIFKIGYLVGNWIWFYVFGAFGFAKGMWDIAHIGKTIAQALLTVGGMVILYCSMSLFTIVTSALLADMSSNWLACSVLILSIGMMIVAGTGFINDFLGIDDGTRTMMRSMMMTGKYVRMAKKAALPLGIPLGMLASHLSSQEGRSESDASKSDTQNNADFHNAQNRRFGYEANEQASRQNDTQVDAAQSGRVDMEQQMHQSNAYMQQNPEQDADRRFGYETNDAAGDPMNRFTEEKSADMREQPFSDPYADERRYDAQKDFSEDRSYASREDVRFDDTAKNNLDGKESTAYDTQKREDHRKYDADDHFSSMGFAESDVQRLWKDIEHETEQKRKKE